MNRLIFFLLFCTILSASTVYGLTIFGICLFDCKPPSISSQSKIIEVNGTKYNFSVDPISEGTVLIKDGELKIINSTNINITISDTTLEVKSSVPMYEIDKIVNSREWGYLLAGNEIVKSKNKLIRKGDYICDSTNYIDSGSGLRKTIDYNNCIIYPKQRKVVTKSGTNENGTFFYNETINTRNITKLDDYTYKIDFLDVYDPKSQGLATGLIDYFNFSKDAVNTISGSSNGTLVDSPLNIECQTGNCYHFDGVSDHVTIDGSAYGDLLEGTNTVTVSFWFNTTDAGASTWPIHTGRTNNNDLLNGFSVCSNAMRYAIRDDTGSWKYNPACNSTNLKDGEWHHAIAVIDANTNNIQMFIDDYITYNQSYTAFTDDYDSLTVAGIRYTAFSAPFVGGIDEFAIWNRLLNRSEVNETYSWGVNSTSFMDDADASAGTISLELIQPTTDYNHVRNSTYMYQLNVSCSGGPCNDIEVTLDPEYSQKVLSTTADAFESNLGVMDVTGTGYEVDVVDEWAGFKFYYINITSDAVNLNAIFDMATYSTSSDEPYHRVYADDMEYPAHFSTNANNISNRVKTTNYVLFGTGTNRACSQYEYYRHCSNPTTINVTTIVQELVDSGYDFTGDLNDAIVLLVTNIDGNGNDDLGITTRDYSSGEFAGTLNISWDFAPDEPEGSDVYWLAFNDFSNYTNRNSVSINFSYNGNHTYTEWWRNDSIIANNSLFTYNHTGLIGGAGYVFNVSIYYNQSIYNSSEFTIFTDPWPNIYWINFVDITNYTDNGSIYLNFSYSGNFTGTNWSKDGALQASDLNVYYNFTNLIPNTQYNLSINISYNSTIMNYTDMLITTTADPSVKYGAISVEEGATPFWAQNTSNPMSTFSLTDGQSAIIGYNVNASGPIDSVHEVFWIVTSSNSDPINSTRFDVTITAPEAGDTCTYSSGNWNVDCSDNCLIDSNTDIGGNLFSTYGTGYLTVTAEITNCLNATLSGTDTTNRCIITLTGEGDVCSR